MTLAAKTINTLPSIFDLDKIDKVNPHMLHMLIDFKPRLYQQTILNTCTKKNTLVVLPTGMGKTGIALMLAAHRLNQYPKSKILILAPTKPLAEQIMNVFRKHINEDKEKIVLFTGAIKPEKRIEKWKDSTIIVSTPQGLENDIIGNKILLHDVSLLVLDECHRSTGEYSYNFIAKQYDKFSAYPRILGLTASPGSDVEKIKEICENIYIESIEIRTEHDPDVKPYIQEVNLSWVEVELPEEIKQVRKYLLDCFQERLKWIKEKGYITSIQVNTLSKTDMLRLQGQLHAEIAQGNKDFDILRMVSLIAEAMKVQHALELIETQSVRSLVAYLEKLEHESKTSKVKAVQNIVKDINFRSALIKANLLLEKNIEHPKFAILKDIVTKEIEKNKDTKLMIFNQYRDNAVKIVEEMNSIGANAKLFIGQTKKNGQGMSQKVQLEVLDKFRNDEFNVLVSTAVGEEGIDIPQVDSVIFYEPIPSAIRSIQRRGRTGRTEKGQVMILMAKGTRDEGYKWSAHHKEKRMNSILQDLKHKIGFEIKKKEIVKANGSEKIRVIADFREKGSQAIKELIELNAEISLEKLDIADYLVSNRVAVEFKTVPDFVNSLLDGRLLQQLKELKNNYEKPLVVVEGVEDIFSVRNVHPNAIRGMLGAIAIDFSVPILFTKGPKDTASLLHIIAKREQDEKGRDFSAHSKKPVTDRELQEYIVGSLPGIGASLSKPLLEHFGTVGKVFDATEEELKKVELIGQKKAAKIRDIIDKDFSTL